jgi:hypothetical protein
MLFFLFSYVLAFNNIYKKNSYKEIKYKYLKFSRDDSNLYIINDSNYHENSIENEEKLKKNLEDLKNELEDLKNRNCGEVNETFELEEVEQEYFNVIQKLKKLDKNFEPDILLNEEELNKINGPISISNEWCS